MLALEFRCSVVLFWLLTSTLAYSQTSEENETTTILLPSAKPTTSANTRGLREESRGIVRQVNNFRQQHDYPPLAINPALERTAKYFARFMARTDTYGHTADGHRPAERARQRGYEFCIVSENIATLYDSTGLTSEELTQQLFRGWKRSPEHKKNMLDPDVVDTGIAVAQSDQTGHYYGVQMFGRPQAKVIEVQVRNHTNAFITYELGKRTFPLPPQYTRMHQRCRLAELAFHWPGAQGDTTIQAHNGARYTIVSKDSEKFTVKKDESEGMPLTSKAVEREGS